MKKWLMLVILFVISLAIVSAFSKDDSLRWLDKNIDWTNANLKEASLAFLALKANNYNVDQALIILRQRKDITLDCYPKGSCNTIETAFASLALSSANQDVSKLLNWLDSSLTKAQTTNWYIQISTQKDGSCTITYEEGSANAIVNTTYKIQPYNVDFISIENNLRANLDKPIEQINVNCNKINDPSMIISLMRILNNEFTIVQQESGNNVNLVINNACYPRFTGGSCDEESSFYASWALTKLNKEIKTTPYLEDKVNTNEEYAILYLITKNEKYAQKLIETQSKQGYWDNENIFVTSFAYDSLKSNSKYHDNFNNASRWLESKQITTGINKGSFGTVLGTAAALYLVFTQQFIPPPPTGTPSCGNNILELGEECEILDDSACPGLCNLDNCLCEEENITVPPKFCVSGSLKTNTDCSVCNSEGSAYVDSDLRCSLNEVCQSGICVPSGVGEEPEEEPEEGAGDGAEEKKGLGAVFWISLIIIILILGVGGYFAYKKFFKKEKPGEPEFLPRIKQPPKTTPPGRMPRKPGFEESLEHELDKSIREAERLLKK